MSADVVGASFDLPAENKLFHDNEAFPFPLLSDVDRTVGEQYGVIRPADDPNPNYSLRRTFLIDPEGTLTRIYDVVDRAAHPREVLEDIRRLQRC